MTQINAKNAFGAYIGWQLHVFMYSDGKWNDETDLLKFDASIKDLLGLPQEGSSEFIRFVP